LNSSFATIESYAILRNVRQFCSQIPTSHLINLNFASKSLILIQDFFRPLALTRKLSNPLHPLCDLIQHALPASSSPSLLDATTSSYRLKTNLWKTCKQVFISWLFRTEWRRVDFHFYISSTLIDSFQADDDSVM